MISMQTLKKDNVKLVSSKVNDGGTGTYDPAIIGTIEETNDKIAVQPLPLISTLVHRDLFNHIGGFVENYPFGWYEDENLFWRMKIKGFKQAVSGKSFVEHLGGVTMKQFIENPKIYNELTQNENRFKQSIMKFAKENNYK